MRNEFHWGFQSKDCTIKESRVAGWWARQHLQGRIDKSGKKVYETGIITHKN